jgi:hypothetical protein
VLARFVQQGVDAWNIWRIKNPRIQPNFTGVNLSWAYLNRSADLSRANLYMADFSAADLAGAIFAGANLSGANFTGANLSETHLGMANLAEANLTRADLSEASLIGANVTRANLTRANLHKAIIGWTILGNIALNTVRGLKSVEHFGPSTIGIDTLYRSQGNIPEAFLRGAGVRDEIITYARALVERPFEFPSCFISYSSKDQEFAERLHADLQAKGVRCWFAPHDVQGGRKLHEQIDQAIRMHERLLLILSSHSMKSGWVKTEIAKARQREIQEKRQVLFPLRLVSFETIRAWECFDADTGKDSAREIREYFIPDFSNWKNYDAYQEAFQRLLRDLKPNTTLL